MACVAKKMLQYLLITIIFGGNREVVAFSQPKFVYVGVIYAVVRDTFKIKKNQLIFAYYASKLFKNIIKLLYLVLNN